MNIEAIIIRETEKAICIDVEGDGSRMEWLPKSQISYLKVEGKRNLYTIQVPEWLAKAKNLSDEGVDWPDEDEQFFRDY